MPEWKHRVRNSSLWRISAVFWLLNAIGNGITATISTTPSVYLALGGINLALAALSWFVSRQYRQSEQQMRVLRDALPQIEVQPVRTADEQVHSV